MTDNNAADETEEQIMTDAEDQPELPDKAEKLVEQAQQFHGMMDQAKAWSRDAKTQLRVLAAQENDPDATEQLEQVAEMVGTVTERIEQGDNNRARSF